MKPIILFLFLLLISCQPKEPQNHPKKLAVKEEEEASILEDSAKFQELLKNFNPNSHINTMAEVFGKPKHDIKTIGILIYDGVNELDLMGPRYVLGQAMGVKTMLIGTKAGAVTTVMGVKIIPDTLTEKVNNLDILIIPGGFKGTIEAAYDAKLHEWIQKIDKTTLFTGAVCTGVWVLGATGLLTGKKISTNWYRESEFIKKYGALPGEERFTKDGKYWTSAGVTAGIDMSLGILKEIFGERYAQAVMLDMEYNPQPPCIGGTPDKTPPLVLNMMSSMYDMGILPLIDSLEKRKSVH